MATETKKEDDLLDELEREIEADLSKDFDFDAGKIEVEKDDWVGKTVTFADDEGGTHEGRVVAKADDDGSEGEAYLVDTIESEWVVEVENLSVVEETEAPKKPKAPAKEKPAEEADAPPQEAEASVEEKPKKKPKLKKKAKAEPAGKLAIPLGAIKVPKDKPRDVDEHSTKFRVMLADSKKRGQQLPIIVDSIEKPVLIDGLRRLRIAEILGWEEIWITVDEKCRDAQDRLFFGMLNNETREPMHWIDKAKTFVKLVKGGKYTQRKIGKALGLKDSEVSRYTTALTLPKKLLEQAREERASPTVFFELTTAPKEVQAEVAEALESGRAVTITDVRAMKKEHKNRKKEEGEEVEEENRGGGRSDGGSGHTYRDLPRADLGDFIKVRVHRDRVEVTASIEWSNKTFRNFDVCAEITELLDVAFADEEVTIGSLAALQKALTALKSEIL